MATWNCSGTITRTVQVDFTVSASNEEQAQEKAEERLTRYGEHADINIGQDALAAHDKTALGNVEATDTDTSVDSCDKDE